MLGEDARSKRPLSMISFEMNTTSRSTANKCSFSPRIITPSTKAAAGAFLISSLMPQAWRTIRRSKSRYFSNITRESSMSLPELSTASAHWRKRGYRPPWPESSSLAISCCDRFSMLPLGATRASTMSDDRIVVSKQAPFRLRIDFDRYIVLSAHPHFDHVGIGQGDAAVRPVVRFVVGSRMLGLVGEAVNHDRAPGRPAVLARAHLVVLVRIRHLNGQKVLAAGIAPGQEVTPLRGPKVVFALFLSGRTQAELDLVFAEEPVAVVQIQLVLGLVDDDPGCGRNLVRRGILKRRGRAHAKRQGRQQVFRRTATDSISHPQNYSVYPVRHNRL